MTKSLSIYSAEGRIEKDLTGSTVGFVSGAPNGETENSVTDVKTDAHLQQGWKAV